MAFTLRDTAAPGFTNKGSALTYAEGDNNFIGLYDRDELRLALTGGTLTGALTISTGNFNVDSGQILSGGTDIATLWGGGGGGATDLDGLTDVEVALGAGHAGSALQYNIFLSNGTSAGAAPSHGTLSDARANMAIGPSALAALTQGDYNFALGYRSLIGVTTGASNIAMGYNTGVALSTTSGNVLIGHGAGEATTSKYQVAIGHAALGSGAGGDENVAIGHSALLNCAQKYNIGIGLRAGGQITSGVGNISMGYNTMYGSNYTGSYNIVMGYNQDPSTTSISREFTVGMNGTEILMRGTYATAGQCKLLINAAGTDVPTATLHVKGGGNTVGTTSLLVENSNGDDLLIITDDGTATFGGQTYSPTATLTSSASITPDFTNGNVFTVDLAHNATLNDPLRMKDGGTYIIIVKQTGSFTLGYGSAYKWEGGSDPTITTGVGAVDILTFVSDGTDMYSLKAQNFS